MSSSIEGHISKVSFGTIRLAHLRLSDTSSTAFALASGPASAKTPNHTRCESQDFCGHLTLCSCKVCQAGPDHEVMKGPDHVEIGEAEGIVGVHDGCRDELRAGWRIATEQR